jgi:hypothetical protein
MRTTTAEEIPDSTNKKIPSAGATPHWGPPPGSPGRQTIYSALVYEDQLFRVVILSDLDLVLGATLLHPFARNKVVFLKCEAPSV